MLVRPVLVLLRPAACNQRNPLIDVNVHTFSSLGSILLSAAIYSRSRPFVEVLRSLAMVLLSNSSSS
jgi:hypothetical protein